MKLIPKHRRTYWQTHTICLVLHTTIQSYRWHIYNNNNNSIIVSMRLINKSIAYSHIFDIYIRWNGSECMHFSRRFDQRCSYSIWNSTSTCSCIHAPREFNFTLHFFVATMSGMCIACFSVVCCILAQAWKFNGILLKWINKRQLNLFMTVRSKIYVYVLCNS